MPTPRLDLKLPAAPPLGYERGTTTTLETVTLDLERLADALAATGIERDEPAPMVSQDRWSGVQTTTLAEKLGSLLVPAPTTDPRLAIAYGITYELVLDVAPESGTYRDTYAEFATLIRDLARDASYRSERLHALYGTPDDLFVYVDAITRVSEHGRENRHRLLIAATDPASGVGSITYHLTAQHARNRIGQLDSAIQRQAHRASQLLVTAFRTIQYDPNPLALEALAAGGYALGAYGQAAPGDLIDMLDHLLVSSSAQ